MKNDPIMYCLKPLLWMFLLFCFSPFSMAETPREIMLKVENRDSGKTQVSKIQLSTCRYGKKGNRITCLEKPRIKVMQSVRKSYGRDDQDSKSVIIILEPISERGIGFLQFDWGDPERDTDQWMYFSAIGKVKRIISGNEDEPKTGSFFGTEISFEDMEERHIDDYAYRILGEETYQGRQCWVIESIPTSRKARKSNYSKSVNWVDKERYMSLKSILYNRQGRRVKRITHRKLEKIDGIWVMRRMLVNNLESKRVTTFDLKVTAFNLAIDDQFLTQRTLTDSAFRERNMNRYLSQLK